MANPVMNAQTFAKVTGIAVAAIALLGIVLSVVGKDGQFGLMCTNPSKIACDGAAAHSSFLGFDWSHNVLHVVLAVVGLYIGFMGTANLATLYAKVFGVVYLVLGILGFIPGVVTALTNAVNLHLELGENLVHVVIGAWGITAGFFGTTTGATTTRTPATVAPTRKG